MHMDIQMGVMVVQGYKLEWTPGHTHTETCRSRLEEELAKDNGRRWQNAKAREMARTATDAGLARTREEREKRRKFENPDFGKGKGYF